jgi:hypothetical protein
LNHHRSSAADNFITFYAGGGTASDAVGAIEGSGAGGIDYTSGSADLPNGFHARKWMKKLKRAISWAVQMERVTQKLAYIHSSHMMVKVFR